MPLCTSVAAVLVLIAGAFCFPQEPRAQKQQEKAVDAGIPDGAEAIWKELREVHADDPQSYRDDPTGYWSEIVTKSEEVFRKVFDTPNPARSAEWIVSHFGTEGQEADIRIIVSHPFMTKGTTLRHVRSDDERRILEGISRGFSKCILKDQKVLDRYYHVIQYSKSFLDVTGAATGKIIEGIGERREDTVWSRMRMFILLASAFSRQDLLKELSVSNFEERTQELNEWIKHKEKYLVPSPDGIRWVADESLMPSDEVPSLEFPKVPFPDWKSPPPPPPFILFPE